MRKEGFTLIEILVVIALMGILTSVSIAAYNSFNERSILKRETLDVVSKLKRVQNIATAGTDFCSVNVTDFGLESYIFVVGDHPVNSWGPLAPNEYWIGVYCIDPLGEDFGYSYTQDPNRFEVLNTLNDVEFTKITVDGVEYPQLIIYFRTIGRSLVYREHNAIPQTPFFSGTAALYLTRGGIPIPNHY